MSPSGFALRRAACFAPLAALLVPAVVRAEPAALPAPPPGSTEAPKPKAPGERIALQLEEAELGDLVRTIGELTGKRFVIASPKLAKVKASVFAPQKVTVGEAYQAFLAVLSANGLTVVPQSGFYKIVESADVARQLTPLERGELPREERYVTRIHRLAHLPAEDVATNVLSKLATKDASIVPYGDVLIITESSANLRRMLEVLDVIDQGGEADKVWLRPIQFLPAAQVEKELSEMLGLKGASQGAPSPAGAALHVARIVALERPNAVVVVGTRASFDRIERLLEMIDVAPSNELKMQVVLLQHADAKKVVGPINEALGNAAATPANGALAPGRGGAAGAASPVAALEAPVKVSADETSNALIVTATPRDFVHVREVIRELDRPKRQVYIEAAILDLSTENGLSVGVAWHGGGQGKAAVGPDGTQTAYGGFRAATSASIPTDELQALALGVRGPEIPFLSGALGEKLGLSTIPSFGAFLSAVATQKGADILSTPTILASDNTAAEIKVQLKTSLQPNAPQLNALGAGLGGLTGAAGAAGALSGFGASGGSNIAASYAGIGPRVKVTPHLNESDDVRLDIEEVISDIQSAPGPSDTFGTVSYLERTASTTLTVKNGQTIVIGGLVRNKLERRETKVPILGDIPLLGFLFRTRGDRMEKSNLVLVLTPHIIRDEADRRRIYERKMQERQEMIDHDMVFHGEDWAPPRDWHLAHGLVGHIRLSYLELARQRREAAEAAAHEAISAPGATPGIELPVPSVAPGAASLPKASTSPAGAAVVRPPNIER